MLFYKKKYNKGDLYVYTETPNMVLTFFEKNQLKISKKLKKFQYIFKLKNYLIVFFRIFFKKGFFKKFKRTYWDASSVCLNEDFSVCIFFYNAFFDKFDFYNYIKDFKIYFKLSYHTINKKIRKFSRGRSGKYKMVINYLPFYKRERFFIHLLKRNYKVIYDKSFKNSLLKFKKLIYFNYKNSLTYRLINFLNYYIFKKKYNLNLIQSK